MFPLLIIAAIAAYFMLPESSKGEKENAQIRKVHVNRASGRNNRQQGKHGIKLHRTNVGKGKRKNGTKALFSVGSSGASDNSAVEQVRGPVVEPEKEPEKETKANA